MRSRYSIAFWLVCLSSLMFFLSFNVIIPEMPDYITSLGGEDYKGFIIGLFTVAAAISRPISGRLTDTVGRIPVMLIGGMVCVVMSVLYPIFSTVFAFLLLRFFHGISTGFMPTGSASYLADIVPADRRGEAMGLFGIMSNLGFMIGNASSSFLTKYVGVANLFYISGGLALISVAVILRLKESLKPEDRNTMPIWRLKLEDVWDKRATRPAVLTLLTVSSFGALLTLIPDYSKFLDIDNKGLFLSIMTGSTVVTRLVTRKLSDRIGRKRTGVYGSVFWVITTLLLAWVSPYTFYIAGVTSGIATGLNSPAIMAWAIDCAKGYRAGRALATMFVALELGIGAGAFTSAAIYQNSVSNLPFVFLTLTVSNVLAIAYLVRLIRRQKARYLY